MSSKSKRNVDARRQRNQGRKTRTMEDTRQSPYLLPTPSTPDVHELDYVAIDCEMLVNIADPSDIIILASVGIVNRDGECLYETLIRPPVDCRINQRSRNFCPVTDQ